ncbi:MAG: type IV pili twitching motility protein PilT [Azospirillum brasilense]|nr:MAG: type IV pili twitching motility protein PilT [Azospirillum brasilense]
MTEHIDTLLDALVSRKGSDLYLTYGAAPALRVSDNIMTIGNTPLSDEQLQLYLSQLLSPSQVDEFESTLELNTAMLWRDVARFRINIFRQQAHVAIVIRRVQMDIPTLTDLNLPSTYADLIMLKRGLVLLAGPTGSGKTTSLAAMVGHRNTNGSGHIITVEDPIEFVHTHDQCIISQRDVGLDTYSYGIALKNALRQRPDLVVIGEVRDREVMEQAIYFAETGHLCVATIHANNSSQAIERVLNFFPEERHPQILLNLALNLRGVLSQRLVPTMQMGRTLAIEVMLNNGLIRQLIEEGKIRQIREMIERGKIDGMQTFDQHLMEMIEKNIILEDTALAEADNPANLRMMISNKKNAKRMATSEISFRGSVVSNAGTDF